MYCVISRNRYHASRTSCRCAAGFDISLQKISTPVFDVPHILPRASSTLFFTRIADRTTLRTAALENELSSRVLLLHPCSHEQIPSARQVSSELQPA